MTNKTAVQTPALTSRIKICFDVVTGSDPVCPLVTKNPNERLHKIMLKWLVVKQHKNDCNYKYVIFFKCVCLCRGGGGLQQLKYEDMLSFTLGIHFQTFRSYTGYKMFDFWFINRDQRSHV